MELARKMNVSEQISIIIPRLKEEQTLQTQKHAFEVLQSPATQPPALCQGEESFRQIHVFEDNEISDDHLITSKSEVSDTSEVNNSETNTSVVIGNVTLNGWLEEQRKAQGIPAVPIRDLDEGSPFFTYEKETEEELNFIESSSPLYRTRLPTELIRTSLLLRLQTCLRRVYLSFDIDGKTISSWFDVFKDMLDDIIFGMRFMID
ncbi:hypothetical protein KQX54_010816 [Cotesia glomerata]|uniref:Uncharacterized protein n=1 Tax=Cotesia glomerata TaxID=32391 RepID=A0AAV7ICZ7_COTGL|nr:hypothetical protein KQX54_010816 [Cotesia glomerata]